MIRPRFLRSSERRVRVRRPMPRMLLLALAGVAALLGLAVGLLLVASAHAETLLLTGATIHPVSSPPIENGYVLIEDGVIHAVGQVGDGRAPAPQGTREIALAGKHIYPGFVSANTVLGLVEISSVEGSNDWQETGSTNPNIRAEVEVNPESELLPVTRLNGVTSALVVPRGGAISGTSALMHLDGWTTADMTVRAPVGLHVQWPNMTPLRGAFFETRSEEEQNKARDEALEQIKKNFDDARAYWTARAAEGKAGIPRHDRDVKWDAMGKALRGEIPVYFHANALNQIRAALRFADDQGLKKVVLVGGGDAWRIAEELKRRDIPVIVGGTLNLPRHNDDPYDEPFSLAAKLNAAGVRWCMSDGGSSFGAMNARNLPYHAAMAAAYGLPREEALKGITLYPAQILGVADKVGSIEPNKSADLIVANGDPLEIQTQIEQVYIAGKAIPMESRQTRLFHKYDSKPRGALARKRQG
jgi:imidazolonepropionase-like amidohydrolase